MENSDHDLLIEIQRYLIDQKSIDDMNPYTMSNDEEEIQNNMIMVVNKEMQIRKEQNDICSLIDNKGINQNEKAAEIDEKFTEREYIYDELDKKNEKWNNINLTLFSSAGKENIQSTRQAWLSIMQNYDNPKGECWFAPSNVRKGVKESPAKKRPINIKNIQRPQNIVTSVNLSVLNDIGPDIEKKRVDELDITNLIMLRDAAINASVSNFTSKERDLQLDHGAVSVYDWLAKPNQFKDSAVEYERFMWFESLANRCRSQSIVDCTEIDEQVVCESLYLKCDWKARRGSKDKSGKYPGCHFKQEKTLCDVFDKIWEPNVTNRTYREMKGSNGREILLDTDEVEMLDELYTIAANSQNQVVINLKKTIKDDESRLKYDICQSLYNSILNLAYLPFRVVKRMINFTKIYAKSIMILNTFIVVVLISILLFMFEPIIMAATPKGSFTHLGLIAFYETFRWIMCLVLPFLPQIVSKFITTIANNKTLEKIAVGLANGTIRHSGVVVGPLYQMIAKVVVLSTEQGSEVIKAIIDHFVICGDKTVAYVGPNRDRIVMSTFEKVSVLKGNKVLRDGIMENIQMTYEQLTLLPIPDQFGMKGWEGVFGENGLVTFMFLYIQNILGLYTPLSLGGQVLQYTSQDISMAAFLWANPAMATGAFKTVLSGQTNMGVSTVKQIFKMYTGLNF